MLLEVEWEEFPEHFGRPPVLSMFVFASTTVLILSQYLMFNYCGFSEVYMKNKTLKQNTLMMLFGESEIFIYCLYKNTSRKNL